MYSYVWVTQSAGEQETLVLLCLGERGGVRFEFISMLSSPSYKFHTKFALRNVNCSVAVLLHGSSIQQIGLKSCECC